jgi:hypothetical protein
LYFQNHLNKENIYEKEAFESPSRHSDGNGGANMQVTLVYATENGEGASYTYVKYEKDVSASFALTVNYNDQVTKWTAEEYAARFVYRGFIEVSDGEQTTLIYIEPSDTWYEGVALTDLVDHLPAKKAERLQ